MEKMIKHIIYRTTHTITGEYYIGLHKWDTTRPIHYWGSYWMRQPLSVKVNLIRETLAEYPDRESARQAEPHWIAPHLGDPLCMNSHANELPEGADQCDKIKGPLSSDTKQKLRQAHLGKTHTSETREKLRQFSLGKTHTSETREKISLIFKGKPSHWKGKSQIPSQIVECPHCGESGSARGMKRWHFDNCKKNPNRLQ